MLTWAVVMGAPGAVVPDVLVLPLVPQEPGMSAAAAALRSSLERSVRGVRGIHSYAVAEDNVNVHATQAYTAMACTSVECAAELAQGVGMQQVVLATLTQRGSASTLSMWRVKATNGEVMARSRRITVAGRWQEFEPQVPQMVRELFPEVTAHPPPAVVANHPDAPPRPAPPPPPAPAEAEREHPSWLVPPAVGAGLSLAGVVAVGAGPFLLATAGLWAGLVYLLQMQLGQQLAWSTNVEQDRVMVQTLMTATILWPALTSAPLLLLAPGAVVLLSAAAWWLPRYLWARKPLPAWVAVAGGAVPVVLASGGLALAVAGSLLALGSYASPWVVAASNETRPYAPVFLILAGLGMAGGMVLSITGAGMGALTVAGAGLTCVPASVAVALGADQRPLHRVSEEEEPLPFDELMASADGKRRR